MSYIKTTPMKCNAYKDVLFDYAMEDQMTGMSREEVSSHLETCISCREKVHIFSRFAQLLNEDRAVEPAPFLYTRIIGRMQNHHKYHGWSTRLQPVIYSVILVAAIYSGVMLGKYFSVTNQLYSQDITGFINEIRFESIEQSILE